MGNEASTIEGCEGSQALTLYQTKKPDDSIYARGDAHGAVLNGGFGVYSTASSSDGSSGAIKYGDNSVSWGLGNARSATNEQGVGASAGDRHKHASAVSSRLITNTPAPLLLGSNDSTSSGTLIVGGHNLASIDLRNVKLETGHRMAGIRNGTEAFAVVGSARAYKNGDEVFVRSSGTGAAGITGNKVWVEDSAHGSAWAELCECTNTNKGKRCWCECHGGQSRLH